MKMHVATIPSGALKVKSRSAYYLSQKRAFVIVAILVSIAPLVAMSLMSFHYYKKSWIEKTSMELLSLAESRREMIEMFEGNQEQLLTGLLELYTPEYLIRPGNLDKVFSAVSKSGVIVDLGVIDGEGNHRAYVGPYEKILSGRNYKDSEWFGETVRKGKYVSDIFKGYRDEPHIIVAVTDSARRWVMRATVNSEYFNSLLADAGVGANGDAYIVNRKGELQTPSRLGDKGGTASAMPAAPDTGRGPGTFSDGKSIYAASPLNGGDWTLVLRTDIDTSLSEFYSARKSAVAFVIVAAGLIIVVSFGLIGHMMKRVEEADLKRTDINNRMLEVEKMALVGRLAASVAHEINNPLQVIDDQAGWIEDLLSDERNGGRSGRQCGYRETGDAARPIPVKVQNLIMDEYRDSVEKIRAHVKRAKTITHKLLGFSRSGEEERRETDLNALVSESASFLENEAERNRIIFRKNFEQGLPMVSTVRSQLQQVFINILNNAIDAIGCDGVVTMSTRRDGDDTVVAEFADSGPGMPEEVRLKIFDPFFSTKKNGTNAGLGLSISYNILQRLGGDIRARNGKNGGCVFTVTVPAARGVRV